MSIFARAWLVAGIALGALGLLDSCAPSQGAGETPTATLKLALTPAAGSFVGSVSVSIASTPSGAEIWYSLDGSEPGLNKGSKYSAAFELKASARVRAWGKDNKTGATTTVEGQYTITPEAATYAIPDTRWGRWVFIPPATLPSSGLLHTYIPSFRFEGDRVLSQLKRRADGLILTGQDLAPIVANQGASISTKIPYSNGAVTLGSQSFTMNFQRDTGEYLVNIEADSQSCYIFQSDPGKVAATGKLIVENGTPRSALGPRALIPAANISLIIRNAVLPSDKQTVTTDASGGFSATGLVTGTSYVATDFTGALPSGLATPQIPFTVTADGQDAGTFPVLPPGDNYRIGLSHPDIFDPAEAAASSFLLAGSTEATSFVWFVKNIGTAAGSGLTLSLSPDSGIEIIDGAAPAISGELAAEGFVSFTMSLKHVAAISLESEDKGIGVTLRNAKGAEWSDRLPVRIYRDKVTLKATGLVKTVYSLPGGKTFYVDLTTPKALPFIEGSYISVYPAFGTTNSTATNYQLLPTLDTATALLPLSGQGLGEVSTLKAYESNDSIATAVTIRNDEVIVAGLQMQIQPYDLVDHYKLARRPADPAAPSLQYLSAPATSATWSNTFSASGTSLTWNYSTLEPLSAAFDPASNTVHGLFSRTGLGGGQTLNYSTFVVGSGGTLSWSGTQEALAFVSTLTEPYAGIALDGSGTLHLFYVHMPAANSNKLGYSRKPAGGAWSTPEDLGTVASLGYAYDSNLECRVANGKIYAMVGPKLYYRDVAATGSWTTVPVPIEADGAGGLPYYKGEGSRLTFQDDGSVWIAQIQSEASAIGYVTRKTYFGKLSGTAFTGRTLTGLNLQGTQAYRLELESENDSGQVWLDLQGIYDGGGTNYDLTANQALRIKTADVAAQPTSIFTTRPAHESLPTKWPYYNTWPAVFPLRDGTGRQALLNSTGNKGAFVYRKAALTDWLADTLYYQGTTSPFISSSMVRILDKGKGWALVKTLGTSNISGNTYNGSFGFLLVKLP